MGPSESSEFYFLVGEKRKTILLTRSQLVNKKEELACLIKHWACKN